MSVFDIFKKLEAERAPVPSGPPEFIICGLGNPGTQYENTRHNAGFMALDTLAEDLKADVKKLKFKSLTADVNIDGVRCLLMKPTTFMNNSGEAVIEALNFYKLPPEKLLVIYDDISLDVGRMRIRKKGSDGGHNGIKSIIYLTGSDTFPRIKIGVGAKPNMTLRHGCSECSRRSRVSCSKRHLPMPQRQRDLSPQGKQMKP